MGISFCGPCNQKHGVVGGVYIHIHIQEDFFELWFSSFCICLMPLHLLSYHCRLLHTCLVHFLTQDMGVEVTNMPFLTCGSAKDYPSLKSMTHTRAFPATSCAYSP